MRISIAIINLVIITLIYVSAIESQSYRGTGMPMDDLVAAIATAAINGAIPFQKLNLGNPNRKGEALRIPILLIRPSDLRGIKSKKFKFNNEGNNWNHKNGRGFRNERDFHKKDYSPKPKFPTHGLKVIPAPKLEFDKSLNYKKNFDKKALKPIPNGNRFGDNREQPEEQNNSNNNNNNRFPPNNGNNNNNNNNFNNNNNHNNNNDNNNNNNGNQNQFHRYNDRINEDRLNRNRLNTYNTNNDRFTEDRQTNRQFERFPPRPSPPGPDRGPTTIELPEREPERPLHDDQDDYDDRPLEPLPQLKPVIKTPTVIKHVYGVNAQLDADRPTIPPRLLKSLSEIPSMDSSSEDKYDNKYDNNYGNNNQNQNSHHYNNNNYNQFVSKSNSPFPSLAPISQMMSPVKDQSVSYKSEPVVSHKYVNLGDVYRKANSEEEEVGGGQDDSNSGEDSLAGYAKDPYDKQLVNTLKNLMASSKNRHPLNIGGLTGSDDSKETLKPVTKTTKSYLPSTRGQTSMFRDDMFEQKVPQSYSTGQSQLNQQLIPQQLSQYSSQSQTTQSKIPESVLTPLSFQRDRYPAGNDNIQQLLPGQVPHLPEVSRKPVSLDLDYNTEVRPLSPKTYFPSDANDSGEDYGSQPTYNNGAAQVVPNTQQYQSSYESAQQSHPTNTYVVSGAYRKTVEEADSGVDRPVDEFEDKVSHNLYKY